MEARGEDPEIDTKATEEAFFHGQVGYEVTESRIRKFSETVIEAVEAAAEKIAEGSRHISDHWKEDGESMASVFFGGKA